MCRPQKNMLTQSEQNLVLEKTRELCSTILAQPNMGTIRKNIDSFMSDDKSKSQYESLMTKGQEMHEKQHRSLPLSGEEVGAFGDSTGAPCHAPGEKLDAVPKSVDQGEACPHFPEA